MITKPQVMIARFVYGKPWMLERNGPGGGCLGVNRRFPSEAEIPLPFGSQESKRNKVLNGRVQSVREGGGSQMESVQNVFGHYERPRAGRSWPRFMFKKRDGNPSGFPCDAAIIIREVRKHGDQFLGSVDGARLHRAAQFFRHQWE